MSKCLYCKKPTKDGIIRCEECLKEEKSLNFVLKGYGWAEKGKDKPFVKFHD
jgi:hypothetical protein